MIPRKLSMNDCYYGRMQETKLSKEHGVHYFMLDVHIAKLVDKHLIRFQKEISDLIVQFKREAFSGLTEVKNSIGVLRRGLEEVRNVVKRKADKGRAEIAEEKEMEEVIERVKKSRVK